MSSSQNKWMGIVAIIATLCCIAVLTLQFLEYSFYQAEPTVWALK